MTPDSTFFDIAFHWFDMMGKCYLATHPEYQGNGGKGIEASQRWHSLDNFIEDMRPEYEALIKNDSSG